MFPHKRHNYASRWYLDELVCRVVAASGNPEDRFHFGKHVLQSLKDTPDFVLQMDGATGESETFGSVLKRSVRCANALRRLGLNLGDVIVLMAPNHLDICIPYYAGFYVGVAVAPINQYLQKNELEEMFRKTEPKVVFCQSERAAFVLTVLKSLKINAKVVVFDEDANLPDFITFKTLLDEYGDGPDYKEFRATDFDPDETIALLVSTTGTTGLPKQAAISHKNVVMCNPCVWSRETKFPTPTRLSLIMSPLQWLTAIINFNTSVLVKYTRLQTSKTIDLDHICDLIKTYKPTYTIMSPTLLTTLMKRDGDKACDFSSYETILLGGSAVSSDIIKEIRKLSPTTEVNVVYAMSESFSPVFIWTPDPPGCCGTPAPQFQYRIIDIDTKKDINEPNVPGELWIKGPTTFKCYYRNPEATRSTVTEDGWLMTGDMFYRDREWYFYFVDRIKLLLKYDSHQISPVEIENLIRRHPGVRDVAVTAVTDPQHGDLPVACVVRKINSCVTAQEIKDLVKENLTDSKQLRGGVIFIDAIPVTPTTKIDFKKLRDVARESKRE